MRTSKLNLMAMELSPSLPAGASILQCPFCGNVIHVTRIDDYRYPEVIAHEAEMACWQHLGNVHRFRFWLYRKTRWRKALGELAP